MTDFIERVRALDKDAVEGPWVADGAAHPGPDDTLIVHPKEDGGAVAYVQPSWDDAEFIAAARSMLPAAVEALARVRELHGARIIYGDEGARCGYCSTPDGSPSAWPCATYQATEVEG